MMLLGPLGFVSPWILTAALGLPALWLLLRAVPPRAREIIFPGTALLRGLSDPVPITQRTPWWLLLLRLAAIAAAILAMAGPVWRPGPQIAGTGPLLIVVDAGWTAAPSWHETIARARSTIEQAQSQGRPVAVWLADGQGGRGQSPVFGDAEAAVALLQGAVPQPWGTQYPSDQPNFFNGTPDRFDTLWLADGAEHPRKAALLAGLMERGNVTVVPQGRALRSLSLTDAEQPALMVSTTADGPLPAVLAMGPDPQGVQRQLARLETPSPVATADGQYSATVPIDLPPELRNRVTRFVLEAETSAGTVVLADDRVRRHKVALVGDARATEGQALLSPLHYLREALAPSTDLVEGGLSDVLPAAPDVIVLVDSATGTMTEQLTDWVEGGGMLIRFAGPRLAALPDLATDPLLPVRLRPGGRAAGGALSWGEPRAIAAFAGDGIFAGLSVPADVTVRAQLLPDPDPELPQKTIAQLEDATPLVTRTDFGQGQLVLFHTSANAEWSNFALSGLFVGMLDRLVSSARVQSTEQDATAIREAAHWQPELVLDGFGRPQAPGALPPVPTAKFAAGTAPGAPAGVYTAGDRRAALNAGKALARADWPGATVESVAHTPGTPLGGWLLGLAALALAADALGSAMIAGRRRRWRNSAA